MRGRVRVGVYIDHLATMRKASGQVAFFRNVRRRFSLLYRLAKSELCRFDEACTA